MTTFVLIPDAGGEGWFLASARAPTGEEEVSAAGLPAGAEMYAPDMSGMPMGVVDEHGPLAEQGTHRSSNPD